MAQKADYDLDLLSPEFGQRFDEISSEIGGRCPVARTPAGWLVTTHEDVRFALKHWDLFSSAMGGVHPWRPEGWPAQLPIEVDPPDHGKFRAPFQKIFAPARVLTLEPVVREAARELLQPIEERGECEVVSEFARPFVGGIFFREFIGVPAEKADWFTELVHLMINGPLEGQERAAEQYTRAVDEALQAGAGRDETDDFLGIVLNLEIDGEPLAWEDKRALLSLFLIGGLDTTIHAITAGIKHLAENAADRERLRADPALVHSAVEEILRLWAPAWILRRTATADVELHGTTIRSGDYVNVSYGFANRDPDAFEDPLTFRLDRPAQNHLAFGAGPHRCIGSHLARLEIRVAIEEFLASMGDFAIEPESEIEYMTTTVRGVNELHVVSSR